MNVSLPYSKSRRYLTGVDWMIGALLEGAKQTVGVDCGSQAILDTEGLVDEISLRKTLNDISARFPILHGRVARDWFNLAPYWRVPRVSAEYVPVMPLRVIDLPEGAEERAQRLLEDHANTPFDSESQHLRFLLVRIGKSRSRLGMVFDHRLLDGFGAEGFFRLIDMAWQGRLEEIAPLVKVTEPAHLDHWMRRFASGKKLNRRLMDMNEKDVCALEMPPVGGYRRVRFVLERLSAEATAAFSQKATEEIGMPIVLPSAVGRAALAMRRVFPAPPLPGPQCLVVTSANMRSPGQEWEKLLFNQFSFLLFHTERNGSALPAETAGEMRDQFFEQMKEQVPATIQDAAVLLRICPCSLLSQLTSLVFKGRMCSVYFAFLRESGYPSGTFMGLEATNLIHTPLAFCPPGFTLCVTHFGGRANLVLSYVEGAMEDGAAREFMREFKALISGERMSGPVSR